MVISLAQPYLNLPDVYRFRIKKQSVADPTDIWYNEWDVRYPTATLPVLSDQIVQDLITFEHKIHYASVLLAEMDVYDYHVGTPVPLPPASFAAVFPIGITGTKNAGGWTGAGSRDIGGEVCIMVQKHIQFVRRPSNNFYRGCLQDQDVKAEAGAEWAFNAGEPDFAGFNAIVAATVGLHLDNVAPGTAPVFVRVRAHRAVRPGPITSLTDTSLHNITLSPLIATNKISRKSKR